MITSINYFSFFLSMCTHEISEMMLSVSKVSKGDIIFLSFLIHIYLL